VVVVLSFRGALQSAKPTEARTRNPEMFSQTISGFRARAQLALRAPRNDSKKPGVSAGLLNFNP
jgi:hypothetical protein